MIIDTHTNENKVFFFIKIVFSCVVTSMCSHFSEYQYINPSTQAALYSTTSQTDNSTDQSPLSWTVRASERSTTNRWELIDDEKLSGKLQYYGNL